MTPAERAYLRSIMQRDPAWAKAVAEEWSVRPRPYATSLDDAVAIVRAHIQVEAFCESVQREWRKP